MKLSQMENTFEPNFERAMERLMALDPNGDETIEEFANEIIKIWGEEGIYQGEMACQMPSVCNNVGE